MIDSRTLFSAIREIKGKGLTQAEVNRINAIIAPVQTKPLPITITPPIIPPHPKIPMDLILGARETERVYPIPASITLAQWALESGWGKSVSGKNNYGGITAKVKGALFPVEPGTPLEPATLCWTHEVVNGKRIKCQRWFKDFATPAAYFQAHATLLGTSKIYAEARSKYPDADAFADALDPGYKAKTKDPNWRAYATSPDYAATLKSIMRSNGLYAYNVGKS